MVNPAMQWDVFCRVIDNYGDIGVCWRLACDLAGRDQRVRLWIDDRSALQWMAPTGAPEVEVLDWKSADDEAAQHQPGDVVIEAFACELPEPFLRRMASRRAPPVWINLEYLSAESYVERSHGLRSPQFSGPAAGLDKWFFYPGFTAGSGGLLREPELLAARADFDKRRWLAAHDIHPYPQERVVTLFCYDNPVLPALLKSLSDEPCLLLTTHGAATAQTRSLLGPELRMGQLRAQALPHLSQLQFDRLLWASDLNFVRGEDSFVRAQWAGHPFIWQIYPQHDGAHAAKLDAFLDLFLTDAPAESTALIRTCWRAWNGLQAWPETGSDIWQFAAAQSSILERWRGKLLAQPDLSSRLLGFVARKL